MKTRTILKTLLFLAAAGTVSSAVADPAGFSGQPDLTAARVVLASLHKTLDVPSLPNLSPRISGPEVLLDTQTDKAPLQQLAGRCGSSEYYCNEPGFTYCCGNSANGFYCAANVNGCTR